MEKTKNSNLIIRGTAKVFRYNAGIESIVDGNTSQQPFIAEYKGERKTSLEYIWYTKDKDGTLYKRGILVSGHGINGVPTLFDYDVLVALEDIFINKKTENGFCELKTENITDEDLKIEYTINELAKEMGYKSPNNLVRDNIKKSIETLLATTIFSMYEGGIYDIRNKKYIVNKEIGYHYLESMEKIEIKDDETKEEFDLTKIKLSTFTYYQILNDYKLFYNKRNYHKVKNRMAKKIYHILLQWKGNKDRVWVNINSIIERIPMIEDEKRYQKRYIKKALKILNDKEIISIKYDSRNDDLFCADFTQGKYDENLLKKYNKYSEIKEFLYGIGFTFIEIDKYVDVENIRQIQALLRFIEDRNKHKTDKNIKKYVITALINPIKLDDRYYNPI